MENKGLLNEKHSTLKDLSADSITKFKDEMYRENLRRQHIFSILLLIIACSLFFISHTDLYYKGYDKSAFYVIYSYSALSMVFFLTVIFILKKNPKSFIGKITEFAFALNLQVIGISIALADVNISNQVIPYVISSITTGALFYFRPLKSFSIFFVSHSLFLFFLPIVAVNKEAVNAFFINTSVMLLISLLLSRAIFSLYLSSFISKEIANEKSEELQIAHEKLLASEKLSSIAKLAGGIAHELNSPLGAVLTSAQLLKLDLESLPPNSDMAENIDIIEDGVKKSTSIIAKLLKYTNNLENTKEQIDISVLISKITEQYSSLCRERKIAQISSLAYCHIYGNVNELSHAFSNIYMNCIEAFEHSNETRETKTIKVTVNDYESKVKIIFEDNGSGIPPENLTKIFDPFFTTKTIGSSMGLGLSLAYDIVKKHNGTITAESVPQKNTKITVTLSK